jgi:crotonobetainyl-CoA:carnitine CoA-transferase CaiB-like acyl-CoA transferase
MQFNLYHSALQVNVPMVANPIKFSKTPIEYHKPPPLLGQDTNAVMQSLAAMNLEDDQECKE